MNYRNKITERLNQAFEVKRKMLESTEVIDSINDVVQVILNCYRNEKGRIFFAGNGGSAADAQHLVCELVGRFYLNRRSLSAEALTVNSSSLTAIANDLGYDKIFARSLEGKGSKGDVFVGISTSGNSTNIVEALKQSRKMGIVTIGLTGENGGEMEGLCDVLIKIPESDTPRIQEGHILAGHIFCEIVEREMFPNA